MLFISAVFQHQAHRFTPCNAQNIASAKTMASKLVKQPGMKAAVAVGEYGQQHFVPVCEIVFQPGETWRSLCPSPQPVALAPIAGGMGGVPPMVTAASALAPTVARGESFANPCAPFAS